MIYDSRMDLYNESKIYFVSKIENNRRLRLEPSVATLDLDSKRTTAFGIEVRTVRSCRQF